MQRSIGAYYRYVHGRLHLFFFTVIKPEPRHWGPKVNHNRKNPSRFVFYTLLIHQILTFRERYVFMTIEDIKHTYLCSIFRPHYVTVITYLPRESDWLVRFTLGRPR